MSSEPPHVLNGWLDAAAVPPEPDLHWGFRMRDRMMSLVQPDRGIWRFADGLRRFAIAEGLDFVLPAATLKPPAPDQEVFRNPVPVVVILARSESGVVLIRRGLPGTFGKLALPGGFQNLGETWQEAGAREFREETGMVIDPSDVSIKDVVTVEDGRINLIFGVVAGTAPQASERPDAEVLEVLSTEAAVELAFPAHTDMLAAFLA